MKPLFEIARCERASEPKGLETYIRKREKGNRNLLGLVFPIKNGFVLAKFAVDVGLESEKYWKFKKIEILWAGKSTRPKKGHILERVRPKRGCGPKKGRVLKKDASLKKLPPRVQKEGASQKQGAS